MANLHKLRKDELKCLAEEVGLKVPEGAKVVDLKNLIENSDIYKNNPALVESVVEEILEEKKNKLDQLEREKLNNEYKLELERLKLAQLDKELELANVRKGSEQDKLKSELNSVSESSNNNVENLIKSVKTLTIPVPMKAESFNLFFQSLEKAFKTKNVSNELKSEILLNILGEKARNLMVYVSEEDMNNYDKLKELVLKEFQPTPRECINNFNRAQKMPGENYTQFASRLSASFEYYLELRKVSDFKSLFELIVSDRLFNSLDRELMTHIGIKQGEVFFKPQELGRECDLFLSAKVKSKADVNVNNALKPREFRFNNKGVSNVFLSEVKNFKCVLCINDFDFNHALYLCPKFKNLTVNERIEVVKTNKLCFKCLSQNCHFSKCRSKNCFCGKPHNRLLHFPREYKQVIAKNHAPATGITQQYGGARNESSYADEHTAVKLISAAASFSEEIKTTKSKTVLLSTARCYIRDVAFKWQEVRCLLDVGSQVSLISQNCLDRLELKSERINAEISCLDESIRTIKRCVRTSIANKDKSYERELKLLVVKKIVDFTPSRVLNVDVNIPDTVKLADEKFYIPSKIDILLGAEIFYELLRSGQVYFQGSQLVLQNTVFGYVASGSLGESNESKIHCGLIVEDNLSKMLERFWEVENVDFVNAKSSEVTICEEHFSRTHFRNDSGRYVVTIPLKQEPSCLGKSRDIALRRLNSLWAKLEKDKNYQSLYKSFLDEYESLGHMRQITNDQEIAGSYYMPHHGVYKPEKSSTPLRVVFNCSSLTTTGTSLNAIQYNGGMIQEDLFSIIINFRKYIFALTADIKKMYRMILVNQSQHSLQRILWRDHADGPTKTYELNTVTYGTVSAPFLAIRTLKQLSIDEEKDFPLAAPVIRENFYMDDGLCGAPSLEEAKELKRQLIEIFARAGMTLHKWSANHPDLSSNKENYEFANTDEIKTLGVMWRPAKDCFSFEIEVDVHSIHTKRTVLSTIARIFDPLGLLGPIIAKAKILMQQLWKQKLSWHEPLPVAEAIEWKHFLTNLKCIEALEIDRCIVVEKTIGIELHGFSDASERCFGAVVYCKSWNASGEIKVKLVASKSRVAPVKSLTIPRLELCAAVLLSKLMKRVLSALKLKVNDVFWWSDSMIVLAWIKRDPMTLKTFVKNRVATIQEMTSASQWHHVSSDQNPADLISRGADPAKLLDNTMWFNGPDFLLDCRDGYPKGTVCVSESDSDFNNEIKNFDIENKDELLPVFIVTLNEFAHKIISLSNNYLFILRVLSYIFRFVRNVRKPLEKVFGPLQVQELHQSEVFLLKAVQLEAFSSEVRDLRKKGSVSTNSNLKSLNPFLDSDGILRVGGRLGNSNLIFTNKHPAILPRSSNLTSIIIYYFHLKYLHVGPSGLLNLVREKFWPLSGRSICRKIFHNCIPCFKAKPIASTQLMGNLPRERIMPDYPFNCTGVDLCGPFVIKYKHQRKGIYQKVYICLFICFVSKAVHLEIVADLTSESFLAALKRFVARRGKCAKLYSDNAKNFVGANKELKCFIDMVKKPNEKLAGYLSAEGIEWKFIPPRAPNFGGLWEAAVKSVKYHLKRVVANAKLTYEEFLTTITQIEGILNSRPLCPLSADTDDLEILTPAHFLIGRSLTSIIEPDLSNLRENSLSKWQRVTKLVQLIWKKWHRSYLSNLQERSKWRFEKKNVQIGDLVLLIEDNLPTHKWVMGRITDVYYGEDKKIRVVQVKTKCGIFKRSISKVCILPLPE